MVAPAVGGSVRAVRAAHSEGNTDETQFDETLFAIVDRVRRVPTISVRGGLPAGGWFTTGHRSEASTRYENFEAVRE
jgi:hypothetical protein